MKDILFLNQSKLSGVRSAAIKKIDIFKGNSKMYEETPWIVYAWFMYGKDGHTLARFKTEIEAKKYLVDIMEKLK